MNRRQFTKLLAGAGLLLAGCRAGAAPSSSAPERKDSMQTTTQTYTRTTPIETVRNDPVFGDYGRLIFPVERSYYSGDTLEQLHLTYYNNIDPDETVDICNTLRQRAADGQTIFYDIYTEDEKNSALDTKTALDAFNYFMRFYTDYNLPYSYNFVTRFRTGEIVIGIEDYSNYNLLQISAPEISGKWGMTTIPGFENEDGTVNNTSSSTGAGCVLMAASKEKESGWEFMKWLTSADTQYQYGKELENVMGVGARYNTANLEAMKMLPWRTSEIEVLLEQMDATQGVPEVPGGYMTSRNVGFAIATVYSENVSTRDTLLGYIDQINQEMLLKRREFGLE